MKYAIEITERMRTVVEVNARTATEALAKAERMYYDEKTAAGTLQGVEFVAILGDNKAIKKKNETGGENE